MSASFHAHRVFNTGYVIRRLISAGTSAHDIRMAMNDEYALRYLGLTDDPNVKWIAQFIIRHRRIYAVSVVEKATSVLEEYRRTAAPVPVVLILVEVPEPDAHRLLAAIRIHQTDCPDMIVEID